MDQEIELIFKVEKSLKNSTGNEIQKANIPSEEEAQEMIQKVANAWKKQAIKKGIFLSYAQAFAKVLPEFPLLGWLATGKTLEFED